MVKPACADNSFGIDAGALVHDGTQLARQAAWLGRLHAGDILVQEFLPGREVSQILIGNPGAGFFPPAGL